MRQGWKGISIVGMAYFLATGVAQPLNGQAAEVRPVTFPFADEIVRGQGYSVLADRRTFAVTAFLNAAGYDEEVEGMEMHPVRKRVRAAITENLRDAPDKLAAWKDFYARDGLPLFVYLDYALALSEDHPFQRIRPDSEVAYAQVLEHTDALLPLVNDFWKEADLESVWEAVKADYVEELQRYDFQRMDHQMRELWAYLRLPRTDTYTVVNVPNLLGQHYTAIGATYETFYYTVETPGAQSYALNVHEYLHSIVNPRVEASFGGERERLTSWYESGREGPYAASYQQASTFVSECLVRALDYRLRLRDAQGEDEVAAIQSRIDEITEGGLKLTRPFFDGLAELENGSMDFTEFVPLLFRQLPASPPGTGSAGNR